MNGDICEEKFAQARLLYMYMFAHPGKKLNFMGNELAMFREWDEKRPLDWGLLAYSQHEKFHDFMRGLNDLYAKYPAFYEKDYEPDGFAWLECQNSSAVCAFLRKAKNQEILTVLNFDAVDLNNYSLHLSGSRNAVLLLSVRREILSSARVDRSPGGMVPYK